MNSAATLSLFNPGSTQTASVLITVYFVDMEPLCKGPLLIETEKVYRLHLHEPLLLPPNTHYALKVDSDLPLVSQHTTSDFSPFQRIPNDMETVALYAGPLGEQETAWYFTDTWMGTRDNRSWYEFETLSICNPNPAMAEVTLTFQGSHATAGKLAFVRETHLQVQAQRVLPVRLWELAEMTFNGRVESDGIHERSVDLSIWLTANLPVVPQKTRRAYKQFDSAVFGTWTVIGTPCGALLKGSEVHA